MAEHDNILEVRNLCQHFTTGRGRHRMTVKAVDDVSFDVRRAETFGLVGESGCGKTTTGRTIIRLYDPTSGTVHFGGREISGPMTAEKRRYLTDNIAMIFQDPIESLNPRMTIEEIVGEGLRMRGVKDKNELHRQVIEMLYKVGLTEEHATRYPHEFSGGQRQRVGIARALALNPEFIVCDEAISALDVSIQAQVVNMLCKFQREMNLTYLFIAHDLSMVRHIAHQTAVMYLGMLVEYGDTEAVYSHPAHPYTQGLLSAVPVADPDYEASHTRIPMDGEVGSPVNPKPGCRFCGRCKRASAICFEQTPELRTIASGHMAACHNL